MKIAIFTDAYKPLLTGVVNSVDLMRRGLEAQGHEVYVVAPVFAGYADADPRVFRYPAIKLPAKVPTPLAIPIAPRLFRRIAGLKPDVIHSQHPFSVGRAGAAIAQRLDLPLVYTFHTQYEQYAHYVPFNRPLVQWLTRRVVAAYASRCDVVVCPAPSIVTLLRSYGISRPVAVVNNGIDLTSFEQARSDGLRRRLGISAAAPVAIFAGRLAVEKNLDFMLAAFGAVTREVADARLLLVGEGADADRLRRVVRSRRLDGRVVFTGRVPYEEIPSYYAASDVFVMTSLTEVRPLAILEAMAAGLPIVAVDASGAADTITSGADGLLAPGDVPAFAQVLSRLLRSADLRHRLGAQARITARQYSIFTTTRRLAEIYAQTIEARRTIVRTTG